MPLPKKITLPPLDDLPEYDTGDELHDGFIEDEEELEEITEETLGFGSPSVSDFSNMIEQPNIVEPQKNNSETQEKEEDNNIYDDEDLDEDVIPQPKKNKKSVLSMFKKADNSKRKYKPEPDENVFDEEDNFDEDVPKKSKDKNFLSVLKENKKIVAIIGSVILVIILGLIISSLFFKGKSKNATNNSKTTNAVSIHKVINKDGEMIMQLKSKQDTKIEYAVTHFLTDDGIFDCFSSGVSIPKGKSEIVLEDCSTDISNIKIKQQMNYIKEAQ